MAQGAAAAPAEGQQQPDLQYSLQEMPARGLLAGGTPPQLAWVPLRVALQLLRSLPQHFVVLQGSAVQLPKQQRRQGAQQAAEGREGDKGRQLEGSGQVFTAVTSPGGLEVHIIPVRALA